MSRWSAGVCKTAAQRIHYRRTGGAGRSLVLLHGLGGSGAVWYPVARRLDDAFDVVMPDARGHGRSSAPACGCRYEDHAADVTALIEHLALPAPCLVGHSMGGMTAALVARERDGQIGGVILVDPTFLSPERQREVFESDVAAQHRALLTRSRQDVAAELRARHPHRSGEMIELLAEARLQTHPLAFDVLRPPNPDYRDLMGAVRAPILLVIGDAPVVSRQTAAALQALNPRVQIAEIAHAGHGLPYDQPEPLARVVRRFVNSLEAGRAGA